MSYESIYVYLQCIHISIYSSTFIVPLVWKHTNWIRVKSFPLYQQKTRTWPTILSFNTVIFACTRLANKWKILFTLNIHERHMLQKMCSLNIMNTSNFDSYCGQIWRNWKNVRKRRKMRKEQGEMEKIEKKKGNKNMISFISDGNLEKQ